MRNQFVAMWMISLFGSIGHADQAGDMAVEFVEKLGGKVERNEEAEGWPLFHVNLTATEITDAGLKELTPLKELKQLSLAYTKVTDAGLKDVSTHKQLTGLNLDGTRITDVGLKELAGLKQLNVLRLSDTKITDVGLKELAGLKQLRLLSLDETKVTDKGAEELRKSLPKCTIFRKASN